MNVNNFKYRTREALSNPNSEHFKVVNTVLALAAVLSVLHTTTQLVPVLYTYEVNLSWIHWPTTALFTFEYGARLWSAPVRRAYALSLMGVIDFVSVIPSYLGLGDFTFLKAARIVRTIRLLRIAGFSSVSKLLPKKGE